MTGAPPPKDLFLAEDWLSDHFPTAATGSDLLKLPLSFRYQGTPSSKFLASWSAEWSQAVQADDVTLRTLRLTSPDRALELRMEVKTFSRFAAVEWVAHFANRGTSSSGIIADILPLDTVISCHRDTPCRLHHAKGSDCKIDDFAPLVTELPPPAQAELAPVLGRSSNGTLPFFNLETGDRGVMGAIGWTGGWVARFSRAETGELRMQAGMARTHLRLDPGEEIRTPRILLLFWQGDRIHGHNMLRQCILAHYTPRVDGQVAQPPVAIANWGENYDHLQIAKAQSLKDHDIPLEVFWIDAGWHGDGAFLEGSTVFTSDWYKHVGNWWPNKTTYSKGLKPVGDALREMGFGFLLWFEPERVYKDTYFTRAHPEWLLGPIGDNWLFNVGIAEAREALTDLVSDLIADGGLTWYRQDFNTDPTPFWEAADAPDRVGMTEIRHIEGLYAFWDELRRRHPGLMIDNCSSGGRRIDLEMISRSIALWRSDFQCWPRFDPIGMQGQTHGLALWVPLSTGCCDWPTEYAFRSALGPGIVFSSNEYEAGPSEHFPPEWLREAVREIQEVRRFFYGDFYPLSAYSLADDVWAAWQFHRPDLGEGMVLALRRPNSLFTRMEAKLRGLESETTYALGRKGDEAPRTVSGAELMAEGIEIEISERPGTALYLYKRV